MLLQTVLGDERRIFDFGTVIREEQIVAICVFIGWKALSLFVRKCEIMYEENH